MDFEGANKINYASFSEFSEQPELLISTTGALSVYTLSNATKTGDVCSVSRGVCRKGPEYVASAGTGEHPFSTGRKLYINPDFSGDLLVLNFETPIFNIITSTTFILVVLETEVQLFRTTPPVDEESMSKPVHRLTQPTILNSKGLAALSRLGSTMVLPSDTNETSLSIFEDEKKVTEINTGYYETFAINDAGTLIAVATAQSILIFSKNGKNWTKQSDLSHTCWKPYHINFIKDSKMVVCTGYLGRIEVFSTAPKSTNLFSLVFARKPDYAFFRKVDNRCITHFTQGRLYVFEQDHVLTAFEVPDVPTGEPSELRPFFTFGEIAIETPATTFFSPF